MKVPASALYFGELIHRRYRPARHQLKYRVANVFLDVDELAQISTASRLIGYNRRKVFGIHDRHHGPGDGTPIAVHARELIEKTIAPAKAGRIFMFCYPAVFGFVFNPLTVYFGFDQNGDLSAVVYEVNNTFGQRHSYPLRISNAKAHTAEKQFYVSPFNPVAGEYRFDTDLSEDRLRLNIALFEGADLKLCARFDGQRRALGDRALLASFLSILVQPLKVLFGIHWHAMMLFMKGLRLHQRPEHPKFKTSEQRT